MKNTVIIKGNRYGISIVLDKDLEFSQLLKDLSQKLENAENFFDSDKQLAVTFEGRTLTNDELDEILSVIKNNSKLNIQYVMEENSDLEATFFDIIQTAKETEKAEEKTEEEQLEPLEVSGVLSSLQENVHSDMQTNQEGLFYRGTLRSGQSLEAKSSLIIIGDVNPGATVIAGGNIVVIGSLKGSVTAGADGNYNAFVMALDMDAMQIQIADVIARSSDTKRTSKSEKEAIKEAMIATIVDNQICIDVISKSAIHDINF